MNCGFLLVVSAAISGTWFSSEIFTRLSTPQMPLLASSATAQAWCGGRSAGTSPVHGGRHEQQSRPSIALVTLRTEIEFA